MQRTTMSSASSPLRVAVLAVTALLVGLLGATVAAHPAEAFVRPSDESVIQRILADTNAIRAANNLGPLKRNTAIDTVARNWSGQQAAAGSMTHNPSFSTQIPSGWTRAGENVAFGQDPTATASDGYISVVSAWKNSPGHLANILGDYTDIGIGIAYGSNGYPYYTQNFGKYGQSLPPATPADGVSAAGSTPIYRFWSPQNQTHFYTASAQERDVIISSYPARIWTYEGIAYRAFATQAAGTVPLYRFYSPRLGGHFFTASAQERDVIISSYPPSTWTYEGIAYYVYPAGSTAANTTPVYRFWSPKNQHHFYTSNPQERDVIISSYPAYIWTYECQVFSVPTS
jgi:uncharacterized protein YkwD